MAMKSWIGTLACAVLALGLSTAAEAQTCSAIQDDAFDFSMDVGDDVDDFRQTVGAASTAEDCAKMCTAAAKGCRKSLQTDLKADRVEDQTVAKQGRTQCKTTADPTACKDILKATKALVVLTFKNDQTAINAACADLNLIDACNVRCMTQVEPADCEDAFGL